MAENADSIEERASREATDWLILLQDEPEDRALRQRFEAWLWRTPANEAAWAVTQLTTSAIEASAPAHEQRWRPFVDQQSPTEAARDFPPPKRRRWGVRLAALAAAACVAAFFVPQALLNLQADVVTGTGEVRRLALPDGSTAVLAPESAIAVSYDEKARVIELLAGEVFFEVAPNPRRPFHVSSRGIRASVLGTAFSVAREGGGTRVALAEGSLLVGDEGKSTGLAERLEPGQVLRISSAGDVVRSSRPPSQIAAWRKGRLIAQDESIRSVVERLERYYAGRIFITDDALTQRSVTGVFDVEDPLAALRGIARAHNVKLREVTPWIIVISEK